MRGKEVVGQTPLFNAPLPAGTHMLTLVAVIMGVGMLAGGLLTRRGGGPEPAAEPAK